MIKSRKLFVVLVMATLGLTTGASLVEADPLANLPWSFEAIAGITGGDVGKHTSIAFNPSTGKPYISYYDETNGDLRLIYPHATAGNCGPANEWYCEAVDTGGDVGQYSSIDYFHDDATGVNKIGISYFDVTNAGLKVAIWSTSPSPGWGISTIESNDGTSLDRYGMYSSLKFDSSGVANVSYAQLDIIGADYLKYASYVGSGGNCGEDASADKWQCEVVANSLPESTSLALTSNDVPAITYQDGPNGWLTICVGNDNPWPCLRIANGGSLSSLAIDEGGLPHIGYYDSLDGDLKYTTYVGSGGNCGYNPLTLQYQYQCDTIETIGDGQSQVGISIAVDLEGYPIIAYQEDSDPMGFPVLNVARPAPAHGSFAGNCGPIVNLFHGWQCTTIDDATQGGGAGSLYEADFAAVGVAPNGLASIAYYEIDGHNDEGRLKFATQEIPGLLFGNGFETGNTYAWAEVVGGQ